MSYRGGVAYQERREPPDSGRGNYYYGGGGYADRSSGGQYNNNMGSRGAPGHGYSEGGREQVPYQQQDQRGYQQRNDVPRQGYDQRPYHNNREPVNDHGHQQQGPTHRYPETFQKTDPQPKGPSWERNDVSQGRPESWDRQQRQDDAYRENANQYRYDRPPMNSRSPTSPKQQNYNNNSQFEFDSRQRDYYQEQSNRQEDQYANQHGDRGGQYPARTEQQRYDREQQNYDRGGEGQPRARTSWNHSQYDRGRPLEPGRGEPRTAQSQGHQSYGVQRPERPYDQYTEPEQRQQQNQYNQRNTHNESSERFDPPQVLAKTSGSTAVFGIVAKVDTSPTRQVVSPEREFGSQHQQPGQRTSQSGPHRPPSPPGSPGSRGPQNSAWSNSGPGRQYGQSFNANQDGPPAQGHQGYNRQWEDSSQSSYGQPRRTEGPPPVHRLDKFRDEFNESSGYGSESTHNTDRSYRDQLSPNKLPYEDRQYDNRGGNQYGPGQRGEFYREDDRFSNKPHAGTDFYRGDDRAPPPAEPGINRGPPPRSSDNYPDNYAAPQPDMHRDSQYERRDNDQRQSAYGPQQTQYDRPQRDYDGRPAGANMQYDRYNRAAPPGPPSPVRIGPGGPPRGPMNEPSGVEESHVKSVRAAKDMFEKQSDPRRPPPAPKPLTKPKPIVPNNRNTRPVPPRPRNFSEGGWNSQDGRGDFPPPPPPQNVPSRRSPYEDRERFDGQQQGYQDNVPSHSQSMYNLDDRSRYNGNSANEMQPHAQSMLNLEDRSGYEPPRNNTQRDVDDHRPVPGFRNSYSGSHDARPMVIGVMYNQDGGVSAYNSHEQAGQQDGRRRESWDAPNGSFQSRGPISPTQSQTNMGGRHHNNRNEQAYNGQDNRDEYAPPAMYNQPSKRTSDSDNYVPDVVARSYEAFTRSQPPVEPTQSHPDRPRQQENVGGYRENPQQGPRYDGPRDRSGVWDNRPQNRDSVDRWPTPPPPMQEPQPRSPPQPHRNSQLHSQPQTDYTDDWRRPEPQPFRGGDIRNQRFDANLQQQRHPGLDGRPPPPNEPQQQRHSNLPPPPQQPYRLDSDSSEGIDVDAPTPPPSANKHIIHAPHLQINRSESPYERNKPTPVTNRGQDRRWQGRPRQEQSQPPYAQRPHPIQKNEEQIKSPANSKSPPPSKPQRNSVRIVSPQELPVKDKNDFDFDVGETQLLTHATSKERQRLGKSGALANRKPPSRAGSSSNLLQAIADEDDGYQIEVTDQDLSYKPTPIEVHREESMRVIRAKKADLQAEKDSSSSSDIPSVIEKPAKQSSHRGKEASSTQEKEPAAAKAVEPEKKVDTKLLFKIPSQDVTKSSTTAHPVPEVTEPKSQANRRPPTYLGFGYSPPAKPKTDLLTQFKNARDNAMRTAAEKQNRAMKTVSAAVKFNHGKKEPKSPPKPKLTAGERNAKVLEKMHVEVRPEGDYHDRHHHHRDDERGDSHRSSTRSTSTVKAEKYDGDDDTTNGSRYDHRGRGRDRNHDSGRAKSRGRSKSRERDISPDKGRSRGRSRSRERAISPDRAKSRGRSRSRERAISPDRGKSRGRSRSRERALSPNSQHKSHGREYDRRRHEEEPPYHRRPHSPERRRYADSGHGRSPQHHHGPVPYGRHPGTREPDWVEQFRRGRERSSHPTRRAWVNDPRRVEVVPGGSRRELDMDAFEREVRRATSYNSDFEQPEPRRQMIPSKLMSRAPPPQRKPNTDWMNALKERNKSAARARLK